MALPTDVAKSQCLLNIRNRQDEKCFLYCYTSQFHKTFGPQLIPPNAPWRQRTNQIMYSSENPRAKQPVGEFMTPMVFHQMEKFEQLNNVRVNVFRHSNKKLIPFRISNIRRFSFNLDLLLLSDGSMHHYVLIKISGGLSISILGITSALTIICVVTDSISALHGIDMGDMKKFVI